MFYIGLEREAWLLKDEQPVMVPVQFRADHCGLLVEYTSEPSTDVSGAVHSLMAAEYSVTKQAESNGYTLDYTPVRKIPRTVRMEAARHYQKDLVSYQNFYGYERHAVRDNEMTAGLHISFTNVKTAYSKDCSISYNAMWDYARLFQKLDQAFAAEIKAAKRRPGFYELKPDGRIEYRSLPANIDMYVLIDRLMAAMQ